MVFGVIEVYDLEEVYIVLGGVNFIYVDCFCFEVMIEIGELVKVKDYFEDYVYNVNKVIMDFINVICLVLEDCLVYVESFENDELVEGLL